MGRTVFGLLAIFFLPASVPRPAGGQSVGPDGMAFMVGSWAVSGRRSNPDRTVTQYDVVLRVTPTTWLGHRGFREEWFSTGSEPQADMGVSVNLWDADEGRWVSRWATPNNWPPIIWPETMVLRQSADSLYMSRTEYSDMTGDHAQTLVVTLDGDGWRFVGRREYPGGGPFVWESFTASRIDEAGPSSRSGGDVSTLLKDFDGSRAVAMDPQGNAYVAVRPTGEGAPGGSGDGSDGSGDGSDAGPAIMRVAPDGTITEFAPAGLHPSGLAWSGDHLLAKAHGDQGPRLVRIGRDGRVETVASVRGDALAVDPEGNAYTAPPNDPRVLRVSPDGEVTTFATGPEIVGTLGMAWDADRDLLYTSSFMAGEIHAVTPGGEIRRVATVPGLGAGSVAWMAYAGGTLYVTSFTSHLVLTVDPDTGATGWLAGAGFPGHRDGPVETARFLAPNGIAVSPDGRRIVVAELGPVQVTQYPSNRLRLIRLPAPDAAGDDTEGRGPVR